ncbi:MAG: class I SAM-dependent methyltransferase [Nitrospirales bacterium]|nr:class I SAM-dependent methyltransferase [Nitrospirales bacterium]
MLNALFNDVVQRVLTGNKAEQKRNLRSILQGLPLKPGSRCVDFGCGTGLFAKVFTGEGLRYYGYDIDERLTEYANGLYRNDTCLFTASMDLLKKHAPFDLIMANCCFHHISTSLIHKVLSGIGSLLNDDGTFLLIDILFAENDPSLLRGLFRKLERGAYVRKAEDYRRVVEKHFTVATALVERSHLFSLKGIPVYNDLLILTCRKR